MQAKDFLPSRLEMMTDRVPKPTSWQWIVNFIKSDALKNNTDVYRQRLAELEATDDAAERKALKDQLAEIKRRTGGFFPHASFRGGREAEHVVETSGHIMIDLDKIAADRFQEVRRRLAEWEYTFLLYTTYSGRGLRVIVRIDGDYTVKQFRRVWTMVNDRVEQLFGVKADRQCADITRFSGYAHDAEVVFNPKAKLLDISEERGVRSEELRLQSGEDAGGETFDDIVKRVTSIVERQGCRYAEGHHNEYISQCMYLMNKFGVSESEAMEWGLREFSDYKASSVRSTVRSCYRKTSEHGTLSYAANAANAARGNILAHTRTRNNNEEEMEVELPQPPTFDNYEWPRLLLQAMDCADTAPQRDLILVGTITVLGASLSSMVRFLYGKRWMYPSLQVLGVAPPASGKGVLTWVRRLVEPIHERMLGDYKRQLKAYSKERAAYDNAGRAKADMTQPEQPPMKMFIIAGNNSATGVLENLMDANGIGLICESEADTVSTAIGTDYGHWSDTLRKAFDHDRIAYNRRANKEYREVGSLRLSVLLSGTPAQVQPLIPSAENGLFSRQLFYSLPSTGEWRSQFSDAAGDDVDERFKSWGKQWAKLTDSLTKSVTALNFSLSADQRDLFDMTLDDLFASASHTQNGAMKSWVARLAVNLMRMMSVVAFLRLLDNGGLDGFDVAHAEGFTPSADIAAENIKDGICTRYDYHITDDDFLAVMTLARPLYLHANYVLSLLPPTEAARHKLKAADALLVELGNEFTTQDALRVGETIGMGRSTVSSYLSRMVKAGVIVNKSQGKYVLVRAREEQ